MNSWKAIFNALTLAITGDDWSDCFTINGISLPPNPYLGFSAMTGDVSDAHEYAQFILVRTQKSHSRAVSLPLRLPRLRSPPSKFHGTRFTVITRLSGSRSHSSSSSCSLPCVGVDGLVGRHMSARSSRAVVEGWGVQERLEGLGMRGQGSGKIRRDFDRLQNGQRCCGIVSIGYYCSALIMIRASVQHAGLFVLDVEILVRPMHPKIGAM